jgi:quercetin dioxygenase-like cupin family protein
MTARPSTIPRFAVGIVATAVLVASSVGVGVGAQVGSAPVAAADTRGLHLTAEVPLGALPPQSMYWHIYEFDSRATAEAARPARGTVAEAFGRHWLYVIAEEGWRTEAGRKVSVVGPFIVSPDTSYTARYMRAFFPPVEINRPYGTAGHRHPGPEAWYVVSGGQCLETPNGMILANAGQAAMIPEGWPMAISSVGRDTRRALVLVLHRSDQPYSMAVDDHGSHGAPHAQWTPRATCPQ